MSLLLKHVFLLKNQSNCFLNQHRIQKRGSNEPLNYLPYLILCAALINPWNNGCERLGLEPNSGWN